MSPLTIVLTIVVIVLVFMLLRYLMSDPNTLQNLQDGKTSSTISAFFFSNKWFNCSFK